eukprot:SAG11_NODE_7026_length_1206_cov_1.284553_2_plen_26_part_01
MNMLVRGIHVLSCDANYVLLPLPFPP